MISNRMSKYLKAADPEGSRLMKVRLTFRKKLDILIAYGQQPKCMCVCVWCVCVFVCV